MSWKKVLAGATGAAGGSYVIFELWLEGPTTKRISGVLKMDIFANVLLGFQVALQPMNLFFCFIGVLIGTLVGVLPGLGPVAAMSLLLPSTFHVSPVSADHHAGRDLLRGHVRRIDHLHPGQYSRAKRPPWSPVWTAIRWPAKDGPDRPWALPPSDLLLPVRSPSSA